jgi:hypothetical protein
MAEATLRLARSGSGIGAISQKERRHPWEITLNGAVVGHIAEGETVEVAVRPGRHRLRLGEGRRLSPERSFDVAEDGVVSFRCHSPIFWPRMLAALVKPDLWITLKQG